MGAEVLVETGAGVDAAVTDAAYEAAGARITKTAKEALADADVVLKVRKPALDEIPLLKSGAVLLALLEPYRDRALLEALAASGVTAFSLEMVPRITRAQSMDVLSSQSNQIGRASGRERVCQDV